MIRVDASCGVDVGGLFAPTDFGPKETSPWESFILLLTQHTASISQAQQGATLQNYNNELVKCIEDLVSVGEGLGVGGSASGWEARYRMCACVLCGPF